MFIATGHNRYEAAIMRVILTVTVIAAAIGLCAVQLQAAPANIPAAQQNFTPLTQMVAIGPIIANRVDQTLRNATHGPDYPPSPP